jgi:tetratricopeptide (TPR) repeat protein
MRKASGRFARGATQEAHDLYGKAIERYRAEIAKQGRDGLAALRAALAHYTRAMLVIKGDAAGDASADVQRGLDLMAGREDAEALRFQGLFAFQEALLIGRRGKSEEAALAFRKARALLRDHGLPFDLVELDRERALLFSESGDHAAAREAAEAALQSAHQDQDLTIHARRTLAEVHEAAGDFDAAIDALSTAYQAAAGSRLHSARTELDERIRSLRERAKAADR